MVGLGLWIRLAHPEVAVAMAQDFSGSLFAWHEVIQTIDPENTVKNNGMLLLVTMCFYNIALMIFNMIPVPPLDGSRVAANLFPAYRNMLNSQMAQGFLIAIFFAMFMGGAYYIFLASDYISRHTVAWVVTVGR
jgi:Zn-dependent protease